MPSVGYGVENAGIADPALRRLKLDICRTIGTDTAGGSVDAELMARDGLRGRSDPAFMAHTAPIATLAQAWWENWRPQEALCKAFQDVDSKLRKDQYDVNSTWNRVQGPTAAAIVSANRIGCRFVHPAVLVTATGKTLDFRRDPPAAVAAALAQAVISWRMANALEEHHATRTLLQYPTSTPRSPPWLC